MWVSQELGVLAVLRVMGLSGWGGVGETWRQDASEG